MSDKRIREVSGDEPIHQESVDEKAHGAHGKGAKKESDQLAEESQILQGNSGHKGDVHLSGAGWGSEGSGGSVVDKRPPENKRNNKN